MSIQDDLRLELEIQYRNEDMMRDYNDRSFEVSNESDYFDPYYGDLRYDPITGD